jgi:enoyl-[acyl-carrier protein] reductase I
MILAGKTYVVMGLLDTDSIAYAIGETIRRQGARVVYTMQSEVLKRRYLDRDEALTTARREALELRFCDVTREQDVAHVFGGGLGPVDGVVHSLAYANPDTCLGEEFHTDAVEDIQRSYHVSAISLATVARHAAPRMSPGSAIVAMTFDSQHAYPLYNWMGVHKAALEAVVRALARRHGREGIRVNAVSAGPVATKASSRIPGFQGLIDIWQARSPLHWDPIGAKDAVAGTVAFLLSPASRLVSGQVIRVDGGASATGGTLMPSELPPP